MYNSKWIGQIPAQTTLLLLYHRFAMQTVVFTD